MRKVSIVNTRIIGVLPRPKFFKSIGKVCYSLSTPFSRYMVARKDLNPGDIILREKPMVTGPNLDNAASGGSLSQAVCLGCYAPLNQNTYHPCSKCKAPLCNSSCEEHPAHVDECTILKQNPIGFYSSYSHGTLMSPSKNTFSKVSDKMWSWSDKQALVV